MLWAIVSWLLGRTIQGWTTIIILVSFLFSVQLIITGILGEYVGKIYEEVKRRPLYLVKEKINFRPARAARSAKGEKAVKSTTATYPPPLPLPPAPSISVPPPAAPPPAASTEVLESSNLQTDYGTTPAVLAKLPLPTKPKATQELDSSNLKTDYGTPAVVAKLPAPAKATSTAPPAPTPKKKDS
jgi:hypothetical protein